MMTTTAKFLGGPDDGRIEVFQGKEPPREVSVGRHNYRREVSPKDDGPLWMLVYVGDRP